jgi:hypothetical protein
MGGWFNSGIFYFAQNCFIDTAMWGLLAREPGFVFPETEVLLNEFYEPNETILPHIIPYLPSDLVEQILCEWFPDCRRVCPSLCFFTFEIEIFVLESLASAIHDLSFCLGIILETAGLISRYNWFKEGTIIIHRLNKLFIRLQSVSLLFIGISLAHIRFPRSSINILRS